MIATGHVLPDHLGPDLRAVICGTAVSIASRDRGGYYAGPGNEFWEFLYKSGLTSIRLTPETDHRVLDFGLGLTDIVKTIAASSDRSLSGYDVPGFVEKIKRHQPEWVVFHGKTSAEKVAPVAGGRLPVPLGRQEWRVAGRPVFVLPSASGANRNPARLEGRGSRLEWFQEFASLLRDKPGVSGA